MVQDEQTNHLVYYRKRLRFTQFDVARRLGWKNTKGLHLIETGTVIPTLATALQLGSIYRAPVEFLFKHHYEAYRRKIRAREEQLGLVQQQPLPLNYPENRYI
jgi:DNA-binding XRE family transcriptional regulator